MCSLQHVYQNEIKVYTKHIGTATKLSSSNMDITRYKLRYTDVTCFCKPDIVIVYQHLLINITMRNSYLSRWTNIIRHKPRKYLLSEIIIALQITLYLSWWVVTQLVDIHFIFTMYCYKSGLCKLTLSRYTYRVNTW